MLRLKFSSPRNRHNYTRFLIIICLQTALLAATPTTFAESVSKGESVPSYPFEDFLEAALSDARVDAEFRVKYVLYAVPFTDKNGVEDGDHGKSGALHDHNRNWSSEALYPEAIALVCTMENPGAPAFKSKRVNIDPSALREYGKVMLAG